MELRVGYKQTSVGVIPEDWNILELGEVVEFLDGRRRPIKDSDRAKMRGIFPYYGASGIVDFVNDYLFDEDLILLGEDGENILSRNLPLAFQVSGKIWINNHAHVLRPTKKVDIKYLTEYLESIDYSIFNTGTAQPKLNKQSCFRLKVIIPPLSEQRAIAAALSDADALIASLDALIAKKRDIKQAAMQQLLTGKTRLPGFTGEWEILTLRETMECYDNLRVPLNEAQRIRMKGDYPYCGANGVLDYVNNYVIDDDIILIAEDGGYFDECAHRPIAYRMIGKCWVNNHAHILKSKTGFDQGFFFYSLVHKNILEFLASGTRAKLNKSEMWKIEIPVPLDPHEQIAIANILSDMDAELSALEAKRDKAQAIKQGMMQELLTGRIRLI